MAKKIQIKDEADSGEDPSLVAKVDEMMDPDQDGVVVSTVDEPMPLESEADLPKISREPELPPLDIFADAPSAPLLTKKKSKKVVVAPALTPDTTTVTPEAETQSAEPEVESLPVSSEEIKPEEFDDPDTAKAIDDIVAHEGDTALNVEDSKRRSREEASEPPKEKHGHPIFWTLVFLVCVVAIVMAAFLADPQLFHPLSKIHWSSIRQHL